MSLYPSLASEDYNNIVQAGDSAIIYSQETLGTGGFVIAPWADATSGLRMNNNGYVGIGTSAQPSALLNINAPANVFSFIAGNGASGCLVDPSGDLVCTGSKNAVVPIDGKRGVAMSAIESPVNWFEDAGLGEAGQRRGGGRTRSNLHPDRQHGAGMSGFPDAVWRLQGTLCFQPYRQLF